MTFLFFCGLLSCSSDDVNIPLAGPYKMLRDGRNTFIVRSDRLKNGIRNEIYSWVKDVAYDSLFIVAEQQPEPRLYATLLSDLLKEQYNIVAKNEAEKWGVRRDANLMLWPGYYDSTNYRLMHRICFLTKDEPMMQIGDISKFTKSLMSNDPFQKKILSSKINYWVISLARDTLFGPLNQSEYLKLRQQLAIPDNVKLAFER